jgi:hypothetical protein
MFLERKKIKAFSGGSRVAGPDGGAGGWVAVFVAGRLGRVTVKAAGGPMAVGRQARGQVPVPADGQATGWCTWRR